jgi:hypothetical protein
MLAARYSDFTFQPSKTSIKRGLEALTAKARAAKSGRPTFLAQFASRGKSGIFTVESLSPELRK